jgi:hypothetical protein
MAFCVLLSLFGEGFAAVLETKDEAKKILFIGDSFTYWNEGLDFHFERLVLSANPDPKLETEQAVKGAAPLEQLWDLPEARRKISDGTFDIIVLQEDLPETKVNVFHQYARKFDAEIRKTKAKTILLMAWPYERLDWITITEIAAAHRRIAKELGIPVAPVGLAWERSKKARPPSICMTITGSTRVPQELT